MLQYEKDESARSLENKLRDIEAEAINIKADLSKIDRTREALEINKRQIQKKIKRHKMDLEAEEDKERELDQKEFELRDHEKHLKKETEVLRVQIENIEGQEENTN